MSRNAAITRFLAAAMLLLLCASARADAPIYEEDPYDQLTLDSLNDNALIKIRPLGPADLPRNGKPKTVGKLVVRRVEDPEKEYEILWRSIVKVETFEQLILAAANERVADGKFDEAYDHFTYLERNRPQASGLGNAVENALYEEAKDSHRKQEYDGALALLRELYRRNPKRPGLDRALGLETDKLVEEYVKRGDYAAARVLLHNLALAYPDNPVARRWTARFVAEASPRLAGGRAAIEAGQWTQAAELSVQVTTIWPQLPGARELAQAVFRKHARVEVGVGGFAANITAGRLDDWPARRDARLLYRSLTEFAGASTEGGKYLCPVGEISTESLGRRLKIKLKHNLRWAEGSATLCGPDVSRRLLAMANPSDSAFRIDWSDLMSAVSVNGVYDVNVDLRRPHVRPEAMLQILLTPRGAPVKPGESPPSNGPFVVRDSSPQEARYTANEQYFAAEAGQPRELVERRYSTVAQAVSALKRGEIQAVDRINPWLLPSLASNRHVKIGTYALPLVHCLIPNVRRPLPGDPMFRRALAYGIHRQLILDQMLAGADTPGCVVTSSPFPVGVGADDPMSYASDDSIEPRPYDPRLTIALANAALKNYLDSQKKPVPSGKKKLPMPTLVLACPPDEIARAASASIQKQLKLVGIPIEIRVIEGPLPTRIPDDVDLMYVELATWEPLVDARRLLGEEGLSGGCSPYMSLALRQLDEAVEWSQVRDCLRRVHRIVQDDVAIVPLWQLVEHFAYRDSLRGIAARPVSLYQNIEQWRPAFRYPTE